jgi:hypothetical protein
MTSALQLKTRRLVVIVLELAEFIILRFEG